AWLGSADEAAFYRTLPPAPPDAAELHALLAPDAIGRGRAWLRALRPPEVPLDAGVVEEYRTAIEGAVRFSDDGATIGVVGAAGAIAWDRATGRLVDARTL